LKTLTLFFWLSKRNVYNGYIKHSRKDNMEIYKTITKYAKIQWITTLAGLKRKKSGRLMKLTIDWTKVGYVDIYEMNIYIAQAIEFNIKKWQR